MRRGLVAARFVDEDGRWRAAGDGLFEEMSEVFRSPVPVLVDLPVREASRATVCTFVRFWARHPESNRLMMQECLARCWRVDNLVSEHVHPRLDGLARALPEALGLLYGDGHPHGYYMMIGAGALMFSAEQVCIGLVGVAPRTPELIDRHAHLVTQMLLGRKQGQSQGRGRNQQLGT